MSRSPLQAPLPGAGKRCVDCEDNSRRPAPYPGPRCATHHGEVKRNRRLAARHRRVEQTYGLAPEQYQALHAAQGGLCAICRTRKAKAVDHDHRQARRDGHDHRQGCPSCVRGLLCNPCNDVLAHFGDDPEAGARLTAYLLSPPWRQLHVYGGHHDD